MREPKMTTIARLNSWQHKDDQDLDGTKIKAAAALAEDELGIDLLIAIEPTDGGAIQVVVPVVEFLEKVVQGLLDIGVVVEGLYEADQKDFPLGSIH